MRRIAWITMTACGLFAAQAPAQIPGAAPAPPVAAPPGAAAAGAQGAAAAGEAGGFFARVCEGFKKCKAKLCASPLGQLINGAVAPASALTGGVIPPFCPIFPSAADLAKPGVEGAAAQAKLDALEAQARREAVRYLGTLDCRYFPEAKAGLIAALRTDRVECVRLEAALAFYNGCCCDKEVIEALEITVSGSTRDGNPAELSWRVRDAAFHALHKCLSCYVEPAPEPAELLDDKDEKKGKDLDKDEGKELEGPLEELPDPRAVPGGVPGTTSMKERMKKTLIDYALARQQQRALAGLPPEAVITHAEQMPTHVVEHANFRPTAAAPAPVRQAPVVPAVRNDPVPPAARQTPPVRHPPVTPAVQQEPMSRQVRRAPDVVPSTYSRPAPAAATLTPKARGPAAARDPRDEMIDRLSATLRSDPSAGNRHEAAVVQSRMDWREHPQVISSLVRAAMSDGDRRVRVSCIRQLVLAKAATPTVLGCMRALERDRDAWVSGEAGRAASSLFGAGN